MVFLKKFKLLNSYEEHNLLQIERRKIYSSYYPIGLFSLKSFENIEFSNITIFYGGNGSGKSTLLNIIADKLNAIRKNNLEKGYLFELYVEYSKYEWGVDFPLEVKMITSDDVFDYLLDTRAINANVSRYKERLGREYLNYKLDKDKSNIENYENIKNAYDSKTKSMSKYIRERLGNNNIIEQSNGESALLFWEREIKEDSIYILDEPENSLSAENQLKLKKFIEESTRFYNCQFIISTHSPFLLDLMDAKIYDLDCEPVCVKRWNELENVKTYYKFFEERKSLFEK